MIITFMKGDFMKILIMMLILVFTIPLYATSFQDNTGENFLRISIMNNQEVELNQAVSAPVYIHEGVLPGKQKLFSLLEFSKLSTSIGLKAQTFSGNLNNKNKSGGRRIKSGRH